MSTSSTTARKRRELKKKQQTKMEELARKLEPLEHALHRRNEE